MVFIFIGGVSLVQRYEFTNQPQITQNRIQTFRHLWKAIGQAYPYFNEKNIDWDNVYQEFEPRVISAETDEEFNIVIAEMMTNLKDAHSQLQSPQYDQPVYATVKSIGGIPVLDMVGRSAQAAGLSQGLVLLAVEGVPVENAIKSIHLDVDNAATEQAQRIRKMENLLTLPGDEKPLTLTVLNQDGKSQEIVIKKLPPVTGDTTSDFPMEPPVVTWEKMENNIGLIHVSRLWNRQGEDLIDQFDTALGALMDTDGLVLDLRGNGGGNSIFADQIAGRFITEPFVYGYEEYPVRLYTRGFRKTTSYQVQPRGEIYQGALVVLTDEYVMSSAEWLVGALKDSGRAITVGRTTSGSTGNPIRFYLPGGGWVRYSTAAFYRPNGTLVEGIGYVPDIPLHWTVEEYLSGNDPDLQAALQSMK
jgi:C-terminal processing protease CtpA/Prc